MQAAAEEERDLLAQYRQATDAMRNKMIGKPSVDAVREQKALADDWSPRIRAAQVRQQQFRQEIARRCPVGATPNAQDPACNQ
jgi:hypothetical protein